MLADARHCPQTHLRDSCGGALAAWLGLVFPLLLVLAALAACGKDPHDGRAQTDGGDAGQAVDAGETDETSGADAGTTDAGTCDAGTTDAGTTDAGTCDAGTCDAGTDGGQADAGPAAGLIVDAPQGVTLVQRPTKDEGKGVTGLIVVSRQDGADRVPVADATLEVNGVAVPAVGGATGVFDLSKVAVPVAAGQAVTLQAASSGRAGSIAFPCPTEVTLTAPEEAINLDPGSTFTVAWTGQTAYASAPLVPLLGLHAYDFGDNRIVSASMNPVEQVSGGQTSGELQLGPDAFREYVAQLVVPGDRVASEAGSGFCQLIRRVHVYTIDPK